MSSEALEKNTRSAGTPPHAQYDAERTGYTEDGLVRGEAKAGANAVVRFLSLIHTIMP
jgi:hypothetical protein